MALWITKQRAQTGTVFGFTDNFEGLGVLIDTYKNGRAGLTFPYVMAMLGDGRTPYDNDNDGKANDIGGCSVFGLTIEGFINSRLAVFERRISQPRED
jgi:mannose-binding lectin 2